MISVEGSSVWNYCVYFKQQTFRIGVNYKILSNSPFHRQGEVVERKQLVEYPARGRED